MYTTPPIENSIWHVASTCIYCNIMSDCVSAVTPTGLRFDRVTDLFWVRGVVVVGGCGSPPPRLVLGQIRMGQCDSRRADCHSYCAPTHHTQLDASLQWEWEGESKVHVHTELGDKVKVTLWWDHIKNGDSFAFSCSYTWILSPVVQTPSPRFITNTAMYVSLQITHYPIFPYNRICMHMLCTWK